VNVPWADANEARRRVSKATAHYRGGQPFKIPDDVLKKLGRGDLAAGFASVCETLACHPMAGRFGEIPAEIVASLGDGDAITRRKVLQKFVATVRGGKKPVSRVIIRGNRANAFVSVDHQ
jgi:hypothetical protein